MNHRPFPASPLLAATPGDGIQSKGRNLGVHGRQLQRWRRIGLTVDQADDLACRIGRHPSELWGEAWWTA